MILQKPVLAEMFRPPALRCSTNSLSRFEFLLSPAAAAFPAFSPEAAASPEITYPAASPEEAAAPDAAFPAASPEEASAPSLPAYYEETTAPEAAPPAEVCIKHLLCCVAASASLSHTRLWTIDSPDGLPQACLNGVIIKLKMLMSLIFLECAEEAKQDLLLENSCSPLK